MEFLEVDGYETIFENYSDNRFLDAKPLHTLIEIILSSTPSLFNISEPSIT